MSRKDLDAAIIKAVRDGTHTLVPMPGDGRKFFIGHYGDADIQDDALVLILDLKPEKFEAEQLIGHMMGDLCDVADGEWSQDRAAASGKVVGEKSDGEIPF